MWQRLYSELAPKGFVVITVAFDSAGAEAAGPWIRAANPAHPSLIDREHLVAELYGMVNVPMAAWIDEEGRIVRPSEPAGASDAFRAMDRETFAMPPEAAAEARAIRRAYIDAIRDWVEHGRASRFALSQDEVLRRLRPPTDEVALAAAHFRMGKHLRGLGYPADARRHFDEAERLQPDNWSFRRQAWALDDPARAGGPDFWAAVDSLGDRPYYEPSDFG